MWLLNSAEGRISALGLQFSKFIANNGMPKTWPNQWGAQHMVHVILLSSTSHILSSPKWCQAVKGNAGILYLEASQNTATITLSHARGFASTHQRRPHRNRAQQGSPVHLYVYLGMAGHSHGLELRTKSTDEWDRTSHRPLHLWRNHSTAIDQAASLESRLLCWGEFNLTISSRKTKTLLFY